MTRVDNAEIRGHLTRLQYHRDQAAAARQRRVKIAPFINMENTNPNALEIAYRADDQRMIGVIAINDQHVGSTAAVTALGFTVDPDREYRRYT